MSDEIKKMDDEFDPERCQALMKGGSAQCVNKAYPGSLYCLCHGGNKARDAQLEKNVNLFRLGQYNARIERLKNHNEARGLQNELGILRMVLEERLNSCRDNIELILQSQAISDLIMKIERVVLSVDKLETKLGNYLSKTEILNFAQQVVTLIQRTVPDNPELIEKLADGILGLCGDVSSEERK